MSGSRWGDAWNLPKELTTADFYTATWRAMLNDREPKTWRRLQANGMAADFSWERSAREYEAVYHRALHS